MKKRHAIHLLYFLTFLFLFSALPVQAKSGKTLAALPEFIWINSTKMQGKKFGKEVRKREDRTAAAADR